jgi:ATP-binding cassette, subfamily C, bacterial
MWAGSAFIRRILPRRDAAGVIALALAVAFLEGVGVFLLVPLLALVGIDVGAGATAVIADAVGSILSTVGIPITLGSVLLVYVGVIALQAALARAEAMRAVRVREQVASRMRALLYRAITRMRWRAFIERHSSHYVHALTTQLDRAHTAVSQSLTLVAQSLIALVYVAVALRVAPLLSLVALTGGALLVLLTHRYARALQVRGAELNAATQRLHTAVVEHLANMKVAKSFAAERQHVGHFEASSRTIVSTWTATGAAFAGSRWTFTVGAAVLLAMVVYVAIAVLGFAPAAVLLLLYVFGRLVPRVSALQQLLHQVVHALPALNATAAELAAFEAAAQPEGAASVKPLPVGEAIRFQDVTFGYGRGDAIITGLSFEIPAGGITAIIGPSGAGKTTIADLLLGLLEPTEGAITVDGTALIPENLPAWRQAVAYVPQETVLFDDTIRNNLLWAVPDADDGALREALTGAGADFAHALPAGVDTLVGERGAWLSGGERQRLALARALLRKPRVLVLDEPTSSLDADTERRILEVIQALRATSTIVLISHREAALAIADRVLVVQRGTLVHSEGRADARKGRSVALA